MSKPEGKPIFRSKQHSEVGAETRARILAAARNLIAAPEGFNQFSIDAVARNAGVARMTVYYQFGSRRGLFEALFDSLAEGAGFGTLGGFGAEMSGEDILEAFVHFFCNFWSSERLVLRRIRGLATLDPELTEAIAERDDRRHMGVTMLVKRLRPEAPDSESAVAAILAATSFETFDVLAGMTGLDTARAITLQLARAALDVSVTPPQ